MSVDADNLRRRLRELADPEPETDTSKVGDEPNHLLTSDGNGAAEELAHDDKAKTISDLVAEVIAETGLLSGTSLALVRARARGGSIAQGIIAAGLAPEVLAAQHGLPYIYLQDVGVDPAAVALVPRHVLARAVAVPYSLRNSRLKVAIADPTDVQAIDELRLATRYTVEFSVAAREDIEVELQRIVKANEAWERTTILEEEAVAEFPDGDDIEADDGISDAPLVRLVNSILVQAAEDGASDVHFDPSADALVVRMRVDGILPRDAGSPEAPGPPP